MTTSHPKTLPWRWGTTFGLAEPRTLHGGPSSSRHVAARAVETSASPENLFLWLCQLRRAPYSYDWIDNFGRRSPRDPDPSMTSLSVGQTVMTIFRLIDFEADKFMTLAMKPGLPTTLFGELTVHYSIVHGPENRILRGDLWMPPIGKRWAQLRRSLLAWGDVVMMRKQLLTLRELAEQSEQEHQA